MASAAVPGRYREPSRVIVLTRRLKGPTSTLLAGVAGHRVLTDTDQPARARDPRGVTFTGVPLLHGDLAGVTGVLVLPLAICALVLAGPRLLRVGRRSHSTRIVRAARRSTTASSWRGTGSSCSRAHATAHRITYQLLAWALQWLACYMVVLALGLQSHAAWLRPQRSCSP